MEAFDLDNYTYEDYLQIDKTTPDNEYYELIFGHIYAMSGATATHQDIVGNIFYLLKSMQKQSKCLPRVAPFDLKIECTGVVNVVQPDIILYCEEKEIPCAIFEVLSPSTAYKDKGIKKDLYESCGVQNYFLVDPLAKTIDKFILRENIYFYDKCYGIDEEHSDVMPIECVNEEIDVKVFFE